MKVKPITLEHWEDVSGLLLEYSIDKQFIIIDIFGERYQIEFNGSLTKSLLGNHTDSIISCWIRIIRTDVEEIPYFIRLVPRCITM